MSSDFNFFLFFYETLHRQRYFCKSENSSDKIAGRSVILPFWLKKKLMYPFVIFDNYFCSLGFGLKLGYTPNQPHDIASDSNSYRSMKLLLINKN